MSTGTSRLLALIGCTTLAGILFYYALRQLWYLRHGKDNIPADKLWIRDSIGIPGHVRQAPEENQAPSPWVLTQNYCLISALIVWGLAALTFGVAMYLGGR